jgi:alpha-L-rhamnosidase
MRPIQLLAFFLFLVLQSHAQKISFYAYDLRTEYKYNPVGVDAARPRFSWKISHTERSVMQLAYEIRVTSPKTSWASGKMNTGQSHLLTYAGPALEPLTQYKWQVRVWDNKGNQSTWSEPASFETGMMQMSWKAKWIEPEKSFSAKESLAPVYTRKTFRLEKKIKSARLVATARGLYRFYLNGKPVTDQLFTPGWTSYNSRLQYQVYDVTALLAQGENTAGAILAEGWYRGTLGWGDNRNLYGKKLGLLAFLHIIYSDGSTADIGTDETWKGTDKGPIRFAGIYDGEVYDAGMEMNNWSNASFNDAAWWNVSLSDKTEQTLITQEGEAVRNIEEIKPVKVFKTPKGELVADMGQNMVGWMRMRVNAPKGSVIKIYHAEVLDKEGNFYTENLRAAKQLLQYTAAGKGEEIYEPHFTFMGFRYIMLEGFPNQPTPDDLTGVVIHSDMRPSGSIETSHPGLNQLQHNIQWGQKGNFLDVPTDCPQRDERLGWTGDAQAFIRTASFNYDIASFFTKWLKDVAADQHTDGGVPFVVPDVLRGNGVSAGWGDVAVIAPMTIFQCYGDSMLLATQYPSMKKYVDYMHHRSGDSLIWKGGSVFGDWLYYHPGEFDHTTADGHTDRDLISTAFFAYSTSLLAKAAVILGKKDDESYYNALFQRIRKVYQQEYVSASGRVYSGSQTSYVLSLMFDLLPEQVRQQSAAYLVQDIKARGNHLSTGFLGTPYLCHVLSRFGYDSVAYDLLLQETYPSWLYPVKMGATTIWERWDGLRPDKSFQDKGMNSFNHYAYGAIGEWMYRRMAGIDNDPSRPGFKHFMLAPVPSARIDSINAVYESPFGKIHSAWRKQAGGYSYGFRIPPNSTATVILPMQTGQQIFMDGQPLSPSKYSREGNAVRIELGSGQYAFTTRL